MLFRIAAATSLAVAAFSNPARAQDASFGCQVLLCAAASNPKWSGVPYCVPVMHELFVRLAAGHSWPVCSEGHASKPGYQVLEDCPEGAVAVDRQARSSGASHGWGPPDRYDYKANPDGRYCVPKERLDDAGRGGMDIATARKQRTEPYYVDITTANGTQRFWFALNR